MAQLPYIKRLTRELSNFNSEKIEGIQVDVNENDIMTWYAKIHGPKDSPYENGIFSMIIKFDCDYPIKPPSIKFLTPMYHPNIYRDGKICVDILQIDQWSPAQNVRTILLSIMSLLMDPNPASPANREAAELYKKDINAYNMKVIDHIEKNNVQEEKNNYKV